MPGTLLLCVSCRSPVSVVSWQGAFCALEAGRYQPDPRSCQAGVQNPARTSTVEKEDKTQPSHPWTLLVSVLWHCCGSCRVWAWVRLCSQHIPAHLGMAMSKKSLWLFWAQFERSIWGLPCLFSLFAYCGEGKRGLFPLRSLWAVLLPVQ